MTDATRRDATARARIDDLLARLPTPGGEPDAGHWQSSLAATLARIGAEDEARGSLEHIGVEDVLRTPLPIESGEPGSDEEFEDELRAPLQSGEHAQLKLPAYQSPAQLMGTPREAPAALHRRIYWLATAAGTLAAAAAVVLYLRESPKEPLQAAALKPVGHEFTANERDVLRGKVQAPAVEGAPTRAAELPLATAAPPSAHATRGVPQAVARAAAPSPAKPRVALQLQSEPKLDYAAGPSNLMDHPSTGAISAAMAKRMPEAQRCLTPTVPSTGVHLVLGSDGSVQSVEVLDPKANAETRACLQRALGSLRVEPFARAQFDINTTISTPKRDGAAELR